MNEEYNKWKNQLKFEDNDIDKDAFSSELAFGTAGIRGVMGFGTNRMNGYVIARVSKGLALQVVSNGGKQIAISYDSRINSQNYARIAAEVFVKCGLKVYITQGLSASPFLAYSVRYLKCDAGVMITASHNPKDYNGYKAFDFNGCQISGGFANAVSDNIKHLDYFNIERASFEQELKKGNIEYIDLNLYNQYIEQVKKQGFNMCDGLSVCYTPLNGGGSLFVPELLMSKGAKVIQVNEQAEPDGNFTTCSYPNPESEDALELAKKYAKENRCDIIIANDPDTDRIGTMYYDGKDFIMPNGDEIGLIICNYLLEQKSKKENLKDCIIVRTIVTMRLIDKIAENYGVKVIQTLTGFKNICKIAVDLFEKGEDQKFIAGYEESNGIAVGTYIFDKDGVCAAMLLCEIAAQLKKEGKNYGDYLKQIYDKYGIIKSRQLRVKTGGKDAIKKIDIIMNAFRETKQSEFIKILDVKDYIKDPKTPFNLLVFELENENVLAIRPSGTEPYIKLYLHATGYNYEENFEKLQNFINSVLITCDVEVI